MLPAAPGGRSARARRAKLRDEHMRLRLYDCYRPARAVQRLCRAGRTRRRRRTKAAYYPAFEKPALLGDYISPTSGHSRGATVDLDLMECDDTGVTCTPLDMGTHFDFFDTLANTDSKQATDAQRANRHRLRDAMEAEGFRNYPMEWWHFTLKPEPSPRVFDVPRCIPVSRGNSRRQSRIASAAIFFASS